MNYNFTDQELLNQPLLPLFCVLALYQGMGGQHGYFGLWLDSDFGKGHSRARPKCTTYGSPQLSGEENFTLDSMEVWAVGKPPEPEEVRDCIFYLPDNRRAQNIVTACEVDSYCIQTRYNKGMCIKDLGIYSANVKQDICSFINCKTMENFIYIAASLLHCRYLYYMKNKTWYSPVFCVSGRGRGRQKKCPRHGSRGSGHNGDDRKDAAQSGPQGARGGPGPVRDTKSPLALWRLLES